MYSSPGSVFNPKCDSQLHSTSFHWRETLGHKVYYSKVAMMVLLNLEMVWNGHLCKKDINAWQTIDK